MSRYLWPAAVVALLLIGGVARLGGEEPALVPEEGVLLLTNGQVMRGKITRAGDHYLVTLPHGEIRLRAAEVDLLCRDLDEGYQRKRAALSGHQVEEHLDLAVWCIRNELFGYAAKELTHAMQLDPKHPRIRLVERSLEVAREVPDLPTGTTTTPAGPSSDDLDRMVHSLPPGTVETFTEKIQPMLLNNCTTAGCHSLHSPTSFKLFHISQSRSPSRRLTQRNLYATLGLIEMKKPEESPLLKIPLTPHGTTKTAIFSDRNATQYEELARWIRDVSKTTEPPQPQSVNRKSEPLSQTSAPSEVAPPPAVPTATEPPVTKPAPPEPPREYTPADSFDAEVFNRRYLGDGESKDAPR